MSSILPLATIEALQVRLGYVLDGPDLARAAAALDDVSALVRDKANRSWQTVEGGVNAPPSVVAVVLRATRREFDNPEGSTSERLGDLFVQRGASSAGGAMLLPEEIRIIRRAAGMPSLTSVGVELPFGSPSDSRFSPPNAKSAYYWADPLGLV